MTQAQRETVETWWGRLREAVTVIGGLIAIASAIIVVLLWLTGGLRPQTQIDQDSLRGQLTALTSQSQRIIDRLDAMPRPSDYAAQDQHLARLDGAISALGDRMTQDEITQANVKGRVDSLWSGTAGSIRNPRQ